jgi:hypothetical protein
MTSGVKNIPPEVAAQLDAEEAEYKSLTRPVEDVTGAAAAGITAITVANNPGKDSWIRTHPTFSPQVDLVTVNSEEKDGKFILATQSMVPALCEIGMSTQLHTLYLTQTSKGVLRLIPVQRPDDVGKRHPAHTTKEFGLLAAREKWKRVYWDKGSGLYLVFPGNGQPDKDLPDRPWSELSDYKILTLGFRPYGRLVDSIKHPLFLEWSSR